MRIKPAHMPREKKWMQAPTMKLLPDITENYPQQYARATKRLRTHPRSIRAIALLDKALVALFAIAYAGLIAYSATSADFKLIRIIVVPAISFVLASILRASINEPRPYERFDIDPLIVKYTCGKSFPGRHVFSATIISCALAYVNLWAGVIGFAGVGLIAFTRIIGGVHFPRDIAAGIVLALLCGLIGFELVPTFL